MDPSASTGSSILNDSVAFITFRVFHCLLNFKSKHVRIYVCLLAHIHRHANTFYLNKVNRTLHSGARGKREETESVQLVTLILFEQITLFLSKNVKGHLKYGRT